LVALDAVTFKKRPIVIGLLLAVLGARDCRRRRVTVHLDLTDFNNFPVAVQSSRALVLFMLSTNSRSLSSTDCIVASSSPHLLTLRKASRIAVGLYAKTLAAFYE
jgi:hypothetical protein